MSIWTFMMVADEKLVAVLRRHVTSSEQAWQVIHSLGEVAGPATRIEAFGQTEGAGLSVDVAMLKQIRAAAQVHRSIH
jgi:hypothetical protein